MEKLYGEIGKKIKIAAYWTFIVEAVIAALEGIAIPIVLIGNLDDVIFAFFVGLLLGAIVAALGVLIAWVRSWLLYGFGELIDKSCDIEKNTSDIRRNIIGIKNDTCDIEKNTRNGQSKMQIDENISTAEAEAAKNVAKRKAKEVEEAVKAAKIAAEKEEAHKEESDQKIISSTALDNIQEVSDFVDHASENFVREIIAADKSENDWEARYFLKTALKYLKDPAELHIIGLLLKLPEGELKATLKEIRQKCNK